MCWTEGDLNKRDIGWLTGIAVVTAISLFLGWKFWDRLADDRETLSTTIRNLSLVGGGAIAILLAVWRSIVASNQADTAQRSMFNDRYQRSAAMLGSDVLSVRIAGIYALEQLAKEYPSDFHITVVSLLCLFVRYPTEDDSLEFSPDLHLEVRDQLREMGRLIRPDVEAAWHMIASRSSIGISVEQDRQFHLYLRDAKAEDLRVEGARFSWAWLTNSNFSYAVLPRADFPHARLREANLNKAELRDANLSGAKLWGAMMFETKLSGANISGTDFSGETARNPAYREPVQGLTQAQLSEAWADPSDPPKLDGVFDATTGLPLTWP